jgi:hypothetical protein
MEKINDLFDQEITRVIDSFPSIYTKDDVVNLLSTLRPQVLAEASEVKPTIGITDEQFQEFNSNVRNKLENSLNNGTLEPIDYNSGEFTIDYKHVVSLFNIDFNTACITNELDNIMLDEFQNIFGKFLIKSE